LGRYLNRQVYIKISGTLPVQSGLAGVYIPVNLKSGGGGDQFTEAQEYLYSIQLKAARTPISTSRFEGLGNVAEYLCTDGFYRYATGSYRTFQEARDQLKELQRMGYDDAFIQTLEWYDKALK
ncbi:MAG: hypothetical protein K8R52_08500, partial [Bacteroidales bacterium]|nr:hypothetical protein [Bacteroidales bacterium]